MPDHGPPGRPRPGEHLVHKLLRGVLIPADHARPQALIGGAAVELREVLPRTSQPPLFSDGRGDRTGGDEHERHRPARPPRPGARRSPSGPTVRRALDRCGGFPSLYLRTLNDSGQHSAIVRHARKRKNIAQWSRANAIGSPGEIISRASRNRAICTFATFRAKCCVAPKNGRLIPSCAGTCDAYFLYPL